MAQHDDPSIAQAMQHLAQITDRAMDLPLVEVTVDAGTRMLTLNEQHQPVLIVFQQMQTLTITWPSLAQMLADIAGILETTAANIGGVEFRSDDDENEAGDDDA